jgi:hypothetical protein
MSVISTENSGGTTIGLLRLTIGFCMTEIARLAARQLAGTPNFWPLESSSGGVEYCWSGREPDIVLSFFLDREAVLLMEIRLYALIRRDFLEGLQLFVDDQRLPYTVSASGALTVIRCKLPVRDGTGATRLKIKLPGALSPEELGIGEDGRKLGIAISEIGIFGQAGVLDRVLTYLRTKLGRPAPVETLLLASAPRLNESTTPGVQSIMDMNSHLTLDGLLIEMDDEVRRQKSRLRNP